MAGTVVCDNITDSSANTGNTTDMIKGSARAWVNFNGTGTVAIRASYNVSSITDIGVGHYRANFTTPMSSLNYCVSGATEDNNNIISLYGTSGNSLTTNYFDIATAHSGGSNVDTALTTAIVHG